MHLNKPEQLSFHHHTSCICQIARCMTKSIDPRHRSFFFLSRRNTSGRKLQDHQTDNSCIRCTVLIFSGSFITCREIRSTKLAAVAKPIYHVVYNMQTSLSQFRYRRMRVFVHLCQLTIASV